MNIGKGGMTAADTSHTAGTAGVGGTISSIGCPL